MDSKMTGRTLILGLGNTLLADEGIGIHALYALQSLHADLADVEFLDGGTLSFTLAGPIEDADRLIVIDAAQLYAEPGTVQVFVDDDMDRYLGSNNQRSVHEVGLIDLMIIARLTYHLPQRRALIGIQPRDIDWGDQPSAPVAAAIPKVCDLARELIRSWQ
jgi:hydrogenase maturation protease